VFAGITLTQQPSGVPVLPDTGVGKLYPLICEGEGSGGWTGSSWGFVFVKNKIMLSNGTYTHKFERYPLMACIPVTAIYTKTGGKDAKYSWVPSITNIPRAATLHMQSYWHIFRNRYSQTHNHPVLGIYRFEVIALWQFLCAISTPKVLPSGEAVLENSCD
jgi:hypothetical protein